MGKSTTWSIASTAKADIVLIVSFVAYHLSIGADHIYLYLDAPEELSDTELPEHERLTIVKCDENYWKNTSGSRPSDHRLRQVANVNHAYAVQNSDWLAHVDVDEYLFADDSQGIADILTKATSPVVRMRPLENFFTKPPKSFNDILECSFHRPFPSYKEGASIRRKISPWCESCVSGLQGHSYGKIFVRKGCNVRINIHRTNGKLDESESSIALLHFYSMGYSDWLLKHLRRIHPYRLSGVPRWKRGNLTLFFDALKKGPDELYMLFEQANIYDKEKMGLLKKYAGVVNNDLALRDIVNEAFNGYDSLFDRPVDVPVDVKEHVFNIGIDSIKVSI